MWVLYRCERKSIRSCYKSRLLSCVAEKSSIKTQRFNSRENSAKILETKVLDDETLQYTCCTVRCNKSVEKEIPEKEKAEFIF